MEKIRDTRVLGNFFFFLIKKLSLVVRKKSPRCRVPFFLINPERVEVSDSQLKKSREHEQKIDLILPLK